MLILCCMWCMGGSLLVERGEGRGWGGAMGCRQLFSDIDEKGSGMGGLGLHADCAATVRTSVWVRLGVRQRRVSELECVESYHQLVGKTPRQDSWATAGIRRQKRRAALPTAQHGHHLAQYCHYAGKGLPSVGRDPQRHHGPSPRPTTYTTCNVSHPRLAWDTGVWVSLF
jgi:hypothetical protein